MRIDSIAGSLSGMLDKGTQLKAQGETDSFAQRLEQAKKSQDSKQLMEACQQFEAYFLHQMIKGMRATVPKSDLFEKSFGREVYEDMLDEKYSQEMSRAGGIGLAKLLYEDLTKRR